MKKLMVVLVFCFGIVASPSARAEDPKPGKIVEVACKNDAGQTYSCYLPKAYTNKKQWPILYCFSPNARGDLFVQRYKEFCEKAGWIVVGSMNSKNGPLDLIKKSCGFHVGGLRATL